MPAACSAAIWPLSRATEAAAVFSWVTDWVSAVEVSADTELSWLLKVFSEDVTVLACESRALRAAPSLGLFATADQSFQNVLSCSVRPLSLGSSKFDSTLDSVDAFVSR